MRQLCQRVRLVHKLRQLGTSEELLNSCRYRPDVHQRLRRYLRDVLCVHSFFDGSLHSGQTDSDLILEQFTNCSESSVAQVVDIVNVTDAVVEVQQIAYRSNDICNQDVLR